MYVYTETLTFLCKHTQNTNRNSLELRRRMHRNNPPNQDPAMYLFDRMPSFIYNEFRVEGVGVLN